MSYLIPPCTYDTLCRQRMPKNNNNFKHGFCLAVTVYWCPITTVRAAQRWDWLLAIQLSFKNTFSKEFWETVLCIYYVLFYRVQKSYGFNVTILHLFYFFQSISWYWRWASDLLHLSLTRNIVWLRPRITGILLYVFRFMGLPGAGGVDFFLRMFTVTRSLIIWQMHSIRSATASDFPILHSTKVSWVLISLNQDEEYMSTIKSIPWGQIGSHFKMQTEHAAEFAWFAAMLCLACSCLTCFIMSECSTTTPVAALIQ